jgi:autotransporter-associated beta strand protein
MKTYSKKNVCLHLQALCALSVLCALLTMTNSARAAGGSATWLAAPTDGNWLSPTPDINWSTGVGAYPGATSGTSSSDIASFTNSSSITTINCASAFVLGGILFDTANASAYTINTSVGTWRLSQGTGNTNAYIRTTSTVVNRQTITGTLRLASSGGATITSDSTTPSATLNITSGISVNNSGTSGILYLAGSNTGNNIIGAYTEQTPATIWGTLVKSGTGTWALTGNSTYHGNTTINGGILMLMGSANILNSPIITINGGTLGVSNALTSANYMIVTNSGALLLTNTFFRTPVTIGTLTASNATFHLSVNGATPFTNIVVTSVLDAGPGIALAIDQIANLPVPLSFPIISYIGTDPDPASFTVTGLPSGYTAGAVTVDTVNKLVTVTVTPSSVASSLVWTGSINSNWDTTTKNWVDAAILSLQRTYADPDAAIFNDTAANGTVTLTAAFSPFNVAVTNYTRNYTFNGTGKITGTYGLIKDGTASLTLAETGGGDFSGGIVVNNGTLVLDNTNSAISGGLTVASGATVQIGNNDGNGNLPAGSVDVEGALIFSRSNAVAVSASIFGAGSLTQNGNGTLTLSNTNIYTGTTVVSKGALALSGAGTISNSPVLLVSNATFDVSGVVGTTLLNDFNITNATINVGPTNLQTPISVTSFEVDGIISKSNIINVAALPAIASYPVTLTVIKSVNPITLTGGNFNFALGSLPAGYVGSLSESGDSTAVLLTLTSGPTGIRLSVTWNATNSVSANTNWSDRLNWQLLGAPATADNVVFGNTGVVADTSTANNVVEANYTIASLTYNQNGASAFHVTEIPSGNTLTVTGAVMVGGISLDGAITPAYMTGGGAFVANGTPFTVNNLAVSTGSSLATLDLSALSYFAYNNSVGTMNIANATSGNRFGGLLRLAGVSNNVTAGTINLLQNVASNGGNSSSGIQFGAGTNVINAGTFNIVASKNSGTVTFVSGAPSTAGLRLRGVNGNTDDTSRTTVTIANRNTTGTGTTTGNVSLNGNPVDMKISTLTIGQDTQSGGNAAAGTLSFDTGIIDVTTINMGIAGNAAVTGATGTINVGANATLVVGSGGLSLVNQTAGVGTGNLNLSGGTVICSNSIVKTTVAGTANITFTGGTLNMVSGTIGTTAARIDSLILNGGSTLQVNVTASAPAIAATSVSAGGTTTINIHSIAGVIGTMQIPIISYNNGSSPISGLALGSVPAGYSGASLVDNTGNQTVDLLITSPTPLVWKGAVNSTWDTSTLNWLNGVTASAYSDAKFVQFDDSASTAVVTLATTVSSPGINVSNNALAYTFNGTGRISGTGSLVKQGTGTLILDNSGTNDFSGGLNIIGGMLQIGNNDTNGTLPLGNIADNGTLAFSRADDLTVANSISGSGGVSQVNTNTLTLSGVNSYSGATFISNGTLRINNTNALGSWDSGTVTITNGGTLDIGGLSAANVNPVFNAKQFYIAGAGVGGNGAIVNNSANAQQNAFQQVTLTADATIGGTNRWDWRNGSPVLNLAGCTLTKTNINQVTLVSATVTDGNININQGILSFEVASAVNGSGTVTVNSGGALSHYRLNSGGFTRPIVLNGGTITNLATSGAGSINDAPITLKANSILGGSTSAANAITLNGVIDQQGGAFGLTKAGAGGFILTSDNTYSGSTLINSGTLSLSGNGSISNSATITVASGASFDVSARSDGTLTLNANQTLNGFGSVTGIVTTASGSTIAPGSASALGILTVSGNVTLGGTNAMKLSKSGTATNDVLSGGGTLALGGTLNVSILAGPLAVNDTFTLFNAAGGISGAFTVTNLPSPGAGLAWDTTNLAGGILKVVSGGVKSAPRITSVSLSGITLNLTATNGAASGQYVLLGTTNIATPLSQWTPLLTNTFDAVGNLNLSTNIVNPVRPQQFYILSQ